MSDKSRQIRQRHRLRAPAAPPAPPAPPAVDARLMIWLSPAFPVGAFAYSHGLELATERGWIASRADLEAWIAEIVAVGSLRNDLILAAEAWRAAVAGDGSRLSGLNEIALALQPSAERHLESVTQGSAFRTAIGAAWPAPRLAALPAGDLAYPVAVGAAAGSHDLPLDGTLLAYGVAFVSNLASAAIRLSVIGQTEAQMVIAALTPSLAEASNAAAACTIDDLASATPRADLASLLHETQYSRLFRS